MLRLNANILVVNGQVTETAQNLLDYCRYRADVLNEYVQPRLMTLQEAAAVFKSLSEKHKPTCPLPLNKQTGEKKSPTSFTGIINIFIEAHSKGICAPRELTTITVNGIPVRTLARRVDGAFPSALNPVAIWK